MRVLIVDDEAPARDRLRRLLEAEPDISVAQAADGIDALAQVANQQFDLIFLDVQMPEASGMDVAASLPHPAPLVVFATAYDRYAIDAFDAGAIDYLLKPCDPARLQRTLQRVRALLSSGAVVAPAPLPATRLLVRERGLTRVVRVEDIRWIETADNYVMLHTDAGRPMLRQTLAGLLATLGGSFVRCHRRAAVQPRWIEAVLPLGKGDCELLLTDGMRVPCSRQYRAGVLARLA